MTEEEYLLGHYPKEMADQAREYINREKDISGTGSRTRRSICGGTTGSRGGRGAFCAFLRPRTGEASPFGP